MRSPVALVLWTLAVALAPGCVTGGEEGADLGAPGAPEVPDGGVVLRWHQTHTGEPPWPHILTCYGGCAAPHYDPSACHGSTACCSSCIDGTWWYSTEQSNFGCGAKLELRHGTQCVVVEVADNGPADWVETQAAAGCGTDGHIIDTSPLVADYFGGGCGWSECFMVDVRPVADTVATGICPSCPCDGPAAHPVLELGNEVDAVPGQARDFCALQGSAGTFDLLAGQSTTQRFYIVNNGDGAAVNVTVGVWVETPYLALRRWEVYDNWSGNTCGQQWCPNDANDNPANPPHDDPGASFVLNLNAFAAGETKRLDFAVEATAYSLGLTDHAKVRLWVKHVDDFYDKADFASTDFDNVGGYQTFNGGDLRTWSLTDVLAAESCNGRDDDCDGVVDDGCDGDGGVPPSDAGPAPGDGGATPGDAGPAPGDGGVGPGDDGGAAPGPRFPGLTGSCGCQATGAPGAGAALLLLALVALRPRRRHG